MGEELEERNQHSQRLTTLAHNKQALVMFLSLESKAHEAVLELDIDSINDKDSVGMLNQLDKLYLRINTTFIPSLLYVL